MTRKRSPGVSVVVVSASVVVVSALVVVVFAAVVVVAFFVVFGCAADADPATSTATVIPSENVTTIATTATALLLRIGFLTAYLRCRSPAPRGSRALPEAGRGGLRSHCGL